MPLFDKNKNKGASQSAARATKILSSLAPKEDDPQDPIEQPEPTPEPVQEPTPAPEPTPEPEPSPEPEPTPEPTPEPEPSPEPTPEPVKDKGPDGDPEPTVTPTVDNKLTEDVLLKALSERLGKEVKSFDEITPAQINLDPELQQLADWKKETGLSLTQWSEYNRDFSQMTDLEVVRENLTKKLPNLTAEELEFKLKDYVFDPESDEDSDRIRKSIKLKEEAAQGRQAMEKNKLELKPAPQNSNLSPEIQKQLEFAQQVQKQIDTDKLNNLEYQKNIAEAANGLDAIDLNLNDELSIKFNLPQEVKNSIPSMVAEMPSWKNEDGSVNTQRVVQDVAKVAILTRLSRLLSNRESMSAKKE